eukprot:SAG11_NODE_855_length_6868_cov_3.086128_7_plen_133_part_00
MSLHTQSVARYALSCLRNISWSCPEIDVELDDAELATLASRLEPAPPTRSTSASHHGGDGATDAAQAMVVQAATTLANLVRHPANARRCCADGGKIFVEKLLLSASAVTTQGVPLRGALFVTCRLKMNWIRA